MILLLKNVAVFITTYTYIIQFSNCFSFPCKPGQIERKNKKSETICCYTTVCAPSHMFDFCQENDGFDVCKSCPEGTYHLDVINTASMPSVFDPCVSVVSCENPEVILQNGRCVCDRQQGYYGGDPHNCRLAEVQCSSPGYELKHNGKCEACDDDFFKDQSDHKVVCKAKTICSDNEEIISNGSKTEDRKCKEKLLNRMTPSKFNSDENIGLSEDQSYERLIAASAVSCCIVLVIIFIMKLGETCIKSWINLYFKGQYNIQIHVYDYPHTDKGKWYNRIKMKENRSERHVIERNPTKQENTIEADIYDNDYKENRSGAPSLASSNERLDNHEEIYSQNGYDPSTCFNREVQTSVKTDENKSESDNLRSSNLYQTINSILEGQTSDTNVSKNAESVTEYVIVHAE